MQIGIISFKVESRTFEFKKPLILKGECVDGGVCLTHTEEPYLSACEKSLGESEKIIREQLALIWDDYVLAPDNELAPDGVVLKNKLSAMAEEMREHKFRAWDKKRKEWLGVNLHISIIDGLLWWQFGFGCKPFSMDECRDIVLMPYTGLKDKNGNEIYEGDVLKEKGWGDEYENWCYGVVDFHNGCFQIEGSPLFEWLNESADFLELEVVGNIHENPELMEEAKLQK